MKAVDKQYFCMNKKKANQYTGWHATVIRSITNVSIYFSRVTVNIFTECSMWTEMICIMI